MIKIISGVYGSKNPKTAKDNPFSLSPEEEARLVRRGVAKYVGRASTPDIEDGETDPNKDIPDEDNDGRDSGVATPTGDEDEGGDGDNPPIKESGTDGNDDALTKPEYNSETSFDDLKEMYKACGLSFRVGMSRADLIADLDEYYGADEDPPELGAEDPV